MASMTRYDASEAECAKDFHSATLTPLSLSELLYPRLPSLPLSLHTDVHLMQEY